jgi:hypothetical protein
LFIPDSDPDFLRIPDPEVKKAPDPGSGSATRLICNLFLKLSQFFLYLRKEIVGVEDHCLVLPDICAEDLITFLRCLFAADKDDWDGSLIAKLVHVGRTIGVDADAITSYRPASPVPAVHSAGDGERPVNSSAAKAAGRARPPRRSRVVINPERGRKSDSSINNSSGSIDNGFSGLSLFLDERPAALSETLPTTNGNSNSSAVPEKTCLLKLSDICIDAVTDDVLTENFCDQDGRLGNRFYWYFCYKLAKLR